MGIEARDTKKKSLTNKYFEALYSLSNCLIYRVNRIWLYTNIVYNLTAMSKVEKNVLNDLHCFTTNVIQERRKLRQRNEVSASSADDRDDVYGGRMKLAMLDVLLDEEEKGSIDEIGIREEVDTFTFEVSIFMFCI